MKNFLSKLKSRKFLTCIAGVVMGLCMVFGLDDGTINTIAGAVVSVVSIVTYIYTEGKIDAEAIKDMADQFNEIVDTVEKIED